MYNNRIYIHIHIYNIVCCNKWTLSCKCVAIGTNSTTPQNTTTQQLTLPPVLYAEILKQCTID